MSVHKSTNSTRELHVLFLTGLMIWTVVLANLYYSTQESNQVYRFRTSRSLDYAPDSIPQHKNLLPIDNTDIIGSLLVAFGLMMSAAGGIGGGGILVPLLIIVFNFEPKFAIPLSNITILGSSITNVIMNLPKRHPDADRPLIDWDLILLMEPLTMAGAIIGALIGRTIPYEALAIALVILLAYTACSTLLKARSQYIGENHAAEMKNRTISFVPVKADGDTIDKSTHIFSDCGAADDDGETGGLEVITTAAEDSRNESNVDLNAALVEKEKKTPLDKVCLLVLMVAVVVSLNILKGGGGQSPLGIQCGASSYWGLTALTMFWMCTISFWVRLNLIKKWKFKKQIKYEYLPGDIEWSERNTLVYPLLCSFAGLFAGLFGVGGGIVNGPLMLHLGVHPLVAASTTAVMIISTSAAAATMFLFSTLTLDYALFLFVLGTVSTVIGQFFVGYFVDKYRRYSYISMSIGFVVLVSAVLLGIQDLYVIVDSRDVVDLSRNSLCNQ